MEKRLGKIQSVRFGHGGYQDACIGIHFDLGGDGWGVVDSRSVWDPNTIKHSENCKWTEQSRDDDLAKIMRFVSDLLRDAKVSDISRLKGVPVEIEFDGMAMKSWRILKEVL